MENEPRQEQKELQINVVPAEQGLGAKNCIVIPENATPDDMLEIISMATSNKAIKINEDEAGDDLYVIQFPNDKQEFIDQDSLAAKLRELSGNHAE
ncbi:MAG: hypothetical protein M1338_04475 [Patescibacteria group bacterium]|nr:hypothetical protein [Patescibacteria group bacterium]